MFKQRVSTCHASWVSTARVLTIRRQLSWFGNVAQFHHADKINMLLGHMIQGVAEKMDTASLPNRVREHRGHSVAEAAMVVADGKFHAVETSFLRV